MQHSDSIPKSLPACSPLNITTRAGDHAQDPTVARLTASLGLMDKAWRSAVEVRPKIMGNPMKTRAANLEEFNAYLWRQVLAATRAADKANEAAEQEMDRLFQKLKKPHFEAAKGPFAIEIRAHVKAIKSEDRADFVREAIRRRDARAVGAVVGAPCWLSGLSPSQADQLEEMWWAQEFPGDFERVKVIKDGRERLQLAGSVLLSNIERLVDRKELDAARAKAKAAATALKEANPA